MSNRSQENGTAPTLTETIRNTLTVTETQAITETRTFETTTISVQTVPYIPASAKAMWGVLGFVLGALVIIAIAWYQARKS